MMSETDGLIVVVPSRGRPGAIAELIGTFEATVVEPDTELWVCVDDDDPQLDNYLQIFQDELPKLARIKVGQRLRLGPTLNEAALLASEQARVVGFMGDDHRPRTKGWDTRILEALGGVKLGVVYGDDLFQSQNLPTAAFQTSALIQTMGYFNPPGLLHLFLDNYWKLIGESTYLAYLSDVVIEHMHPAAGKAESDAGYADVNSGPMWEHDQTEFERYLREDWPTEKAKLLPKVVFCNHTVEEGCTGHGDF